MATITIRNLEPEVVDHLKRRAKRNGHSMEQEVREVLRQQKPTREELLSEIEALWPKITNPPSAKDVDSWFRIAREGRL